MNLNCAGSGFGLDSVLAFNPCRPRICFFASGHDRHLLLVILNQNITCTVYIKYSCKIALKQ